MKADHILTDLRKKNYKPVYWLEGEEDYFIDEIIDYAENNILSEGEKGFNLTTFYGRDTDWAEVINACRRYPMFSEKQVILLKEAQSMRGIEKLEGYIERPLVSTILFVSYKGKKVDGRTKFAKVLKEKGVVLTTKKLYENELPDWTQKLIKSKEYSITNRALYLLIDHIGNDLSRISNEIDKIILNLNERREINEDDIENFVGISKEYNVFELQDALAKKDIFKAIRIAQYFEGNPKAGPIQMILPALHSFFSKLQLIHTIPSGNEKTLASQIGVPDWKIRDYLQAANRYSLNNIEKNLVLLMQYNLKSIGIDDAGTEDALLLKELLVKMIQE
jgi:DNA polymerase III subunit delta